MATCLVDREHAIESLFTAVPSHVRVDDLGIFLHDFVDIDACGSMGNIEFFDMAIIRSVVDGFFQRLFPSVLLPPFDQVRVVVVIIDRIALHFLHYQIQLLSSVAVPALQNIVDMGRPYSRQNIFRALFFE